ncbi:MAG: precorrin-4 C(11)-methyltransferase [Deltaproteobacteria bacterium]|nr:precorrin-4 C(11)-methyltransferase [Deltaproteobacteria bacterium]
MANDAASTVSFVGSGPGDPELITVKGMRLLEKADVVVYAGSLVKEKVLKYCREGTEIHNSAGMNLDEIMSVMVKAAKEGKSVVRLHTGDPSLYGALREQADILDTEGVPYEVVPGVSSAFASAAALKKELTMPGVTQTVIFTRLEGRTPVPERERLSALALHNATICVFLSASMIDKVVEELGNGYPPDTPVAVVYRATWEDEKKVTGTLEDIASKVKAEGISRHALIIVGRAIGGAGSSGRTSLLYDKDFKHGYRKR